MKTFVQFYTPSRFSNYIDLGNGFSDTLDFCKSKGELVWMEHQGLAWASTVKMLSGKTELEKFEAVPAPTGDEIYISALYIQQLYQALVWAKRNPAKEFIVGGPIVRGNLFRVLSELPKNLTLATETVEECFQIPNFSQKWDLEPPPLSSEKPIVFSWTIDTRCSWGKCIYCNFSSAKPRVRENIDFGWRDFHWNGPKIIRLNTTTTTPHQIRTILPFLPRLPNTRYDLYLRWGQPELDAFQEIENSISDLSFRFLVGVEFPSNRMLSFMQKGITEKEIENWLAFMTGRNSWEALVFIILGWPGLDLNTDLIPLKNFLRKIPLSCKIALTRIFARPNTILAKFFEPEIAQILGPFYLGFVPKLSPEKAMLNRLFRELILETPNTLDFTKGLL